MTHRSLGLIVTAALVSLPARADVQNIWLTVKGATCPKCGFGPVKALKRLPGVRDAALTVNPQHLDVKPAPGVWLDPGRLIQVVRRSNLQPVPDDVRLTVTGTIVERGDSAWLMLNGMKEARTVPLCHAGPPAAESPDPRAFIGSCVEILGVWRPEAAGDNSTGTLIVRAIRRLDELNLPHKETIR